MPTGQVQRQLRGLSCLQEEGHIGRRGRQFPGGSRHKSSVSSSAIMSSLLPSHAEGQMWQESTWTLSAEEEETHTHTSPHTHRYTDVLARDTCERGLESRAPLPSALAGRPADWLLGGPCSCLS